MTASQQLLHSTPGTRGLLLGNLGIVRGALEAGVQFVSCYPGTPSSEVGDAFAHIAKDADIHFEYSINEKVSVEIAFAASLAGARSLCSMKHLGLSYANDPASTMPYVGVEGGMVIVTAGDPSLITSPNEQDQRHYAKFLYYPVFDPATPADALDMTRWAFGFSEATRLPVIMRPTTRVCHTSGMITYGPMPETRNEIAFKKNPPRYTPIPHNARRMRTELSERFRHAEALLGGSDFYPRTGNGGLGIIASGVAYAYAEQVIRDLDLTDLVTLQKIGAYPIPEDVLRGFIESVDSVLAVEELSPFVEEWVSLAAFRAGRAIPVLGKHTGHLPLEFEYSPDIVEDAVRKYAKLEPKRRRAVSIPDLPERPPVLCSGCPHRTSYLMVNKVFGKKTVYCNDIGCYTLGYGEPLNACDMLLCMGSSISQASGIARTTGRRTVAYIGDSTFFHSGLPALANAVQADDDVTVVVLDNYITAMTGFQPSPTSDALPCGAGSPIDTQLWHRRPAGDFTGGTPAPHSSLSDAEPRDGSAIERAARSLGVRNVFAIDPFDEEAAIEVFKRAKDGHGVNLVVCRSPCCVDANRKTKGAARAPYFVDQELCNGCTLCVRLLGCPSILATDGKYTIDETTCNGCELCAFVCQHDAIRQVVVEKV